MTALCFACHARACAGVSAYCTTCAKQHRDPGPVPRGAECLCRACGRIFTSVSAFDTHQTMRDGEVVCTNPATARRRNGDPVFTVVRERDGHHVWGKWDARPGWPWTSSGDESEGLADPDGRRVCPATGTTRKAPPCVR